LCQHTPANFRAWGGTAGQGAILAVCAVRQDTHISKDSHKKIPGPVPNISGFPLLAHVLCTLHGVVVCSTSSQQERNPTMGMCITSSLYIGDERRSLLDQSQALLPPSPWVMSTHSVRPVWAFQKRRVGCKSMHADHKCVMVSERAHRNTPSDARPTGAFIFSVREYSVAANNNKNISDKQNPINESWSLPLQAKFSPCC
jgi:hypothetical protein